MDTKLPTFSIIVPTWGDFDALWRTIRQLIDQRNASEILREILVISDGFEREAMQIVTAANNYAATHSQNAKIFYFHMKEHAGNGNLARAAGLKASRCEWVMFTDAGTSVTHDAFYMIVDAIVTYPETKVVLWDIVQLIEPSPITSNVYAVMNSNRANGLPYVIPGIGCAIQRVEAQKSEWPNVRASDWAYWSDLWPKIYGNPEDVALIDKSLCLIPWALMVAYGNRDKRKVRFPTTEEDFKASGMDGPWTPEAEALVRRNERETSEYVRKEVGEEFDPGTSGNLEPLHGAEDQGAEPVSAPLLEDREAV